jgi:hypothetical protein
MDAKPLRIYSSADVPRLRYIAGIILGDILGLQWEIVTDKRKLGKHPVINYSSEKITGCFKICPDGLLSETGISPREIAVSEWSGLPVFFHVDGSSDLPFDIFSASFYLIGRYEEYLDYDPDQNRRYPASSSIAFKNGFLNRPVIDLWARELSKALLKKFQTLTFKRNDFSSLVTVDVDKPFANLGRNFLSSLGSLFRDLTTSDGHPADRYRIIVKGEKDPFEVFDYISESLQKHFCEARFFFLVGDHSRFDKNPSWKNEEFRRLIHRLSGIYKTGLCPSYNAAGNKTLIDEEKRRLRSIVNEEICISRFHSARFFMPASFLALRNSGITEDYSMGYPEEPGFRASIARPFHFYNILTDQLTNLKVIPYQVMDSTLSDSKKLDPENAKNIILELISETKRAGGTFVSIWHNTSLLENAERQGWREVFEFMLKNQVQ